ncbi:TetR/AcrR family transcriptional regulator [Amycolatopsis aidingensis]|uniref:TetR/AcrR family transcriptional regulator n=1 Tax=Amycolatopsis aidingensis TaxID=2842453 RepID=UPI001C0B9213|nr:TetR/AcrR family transcriptional regulator [Amycolatopsis aidingensis]
MGTGDKRSDIVAAAVRIASESGIDAVTVRAVAARAGCGLGTLRHYFPAQHELIDAILPELLDQELHDDGLTDTGRPRTDRLATLMTQFLPPDDDQEGERMLSAWFEMSASALSVDATPGATRTLAALAARAHQRVRQWLRELAPERADDAEWLEDTADGLISLCSGLCLEALTPGSPVTLRRARHLLERAATRAF